MLDVLHKLWRERQWPMTNVSFKRRPWQFRGLMLLKSPANGKLWCAKLRHCRQCGVYRTKDIWKTILEFTGMMLGVPGCKLSWLSHSTECMLKGDEDFLRDKVIFNCYSLCCMSSYISLCDAITASTLCLNFMPFWLKIKICCGKQS